MSPYFSTEIWKEVYDTSPNPVTGPRFWMTNNYVLITKPADPDHPGRKKGQKNNYDWIKGPNESPKKKKKKKKAPKKKGNKAIDKNECGEAGIIQLEVLNFQRKRRVRLRQVRKVSRLR